MQTKEHSWGKLIKLHRQKQQLKQDDVAFGICTPSYLSRIENGMVIAEQAIYEQLLARLGINLMDQQFKQQEQISFLEELYEKLLSNESLHQKAIEKLMQMQSFGVQLEEDLFAKLVYSRYLLSIKEDDQARNLLLEIEPFIHWKHDRLTQLYVAITGFAYLSFLEFAEFVEREERLPCAHYLQTATSFEQANYYYHLAFAYHRNYNFQKALIHIEKASATFSHQYKPLFQLKIYSMKGVIYNDLHRFQEANVEFNAGLDLLNHVTAIQTPMQWSSIHNNIAYCYECQGLFEQAVHHYKIANESEEDLLAIINWMRACYQLGDFNLLHKLLNKYPFEQFSVQHQKYQWRLLQFACKKEITLESLKALDEEIFPYFMEQDYYSLTLFYAPLWGQFYEQLHAYKQSAKCYKMAFTASEKVRQRMSS
ncbi:helix-turn-helix domain-containing protein [Solibacillus sp. FSL R7-0682]|uniref:helix-turn-helix domain-containing protein n=1 Tax=Solibacillus sp. FSL R7-0682 TaxID=2921690 RepID=UPI0030F6A982